LRPCAIRARASRGFFYTHELKADPYPPCAFCSKGCLDAGAAIAKRSQGMIDKTEMESAAIKAARRNFAEALIELGLIEVFHDRTAAEIDRIIEACVGGFQEAMGRLALNDDIEIPF
jgi:hypothetical protein